MVWIGFGLDKGINNYILKHVNEGRRLIKMNCLWPYFKFCMVSLNYLIYISIIIQDLAFNDPNS